MSPTTWQGRSFKSILQGRTPTDWRTSFYYRYYYSHFNTPRHYGVRTKTHKLIHFDKLGAWEMYDVENDPTEMQDLTSMAEHAETVAALKSELRRLQHEVKDDVSDIGDKPERATQFWIKSTLGNASR